MMGVIKLLVRCISSHEDVSHHMKMYLIT